MKKIFKLFLMLAVAGSVTFYGCGEDEPDTPDTSNIKPTIQITKNPGKTVTLGQSMTYEVNAVSTANMINSIEILLQYKEPGMADFKDYSGTYTKEISTALLDATESWTFNLKNNLFKEYTEFKVTFTANDDKGNAVSANHTVLGGVSYKKVNTLNGEYDPGIKGFQVYHCADPSSGGLSLEEDDLEEPGYLGITDCEGNTNAIDFALNADSKTLDGIKSKNTTRWVEAPGGFNYGTANSADAKLAYEAGTPAQVLAVTVEVNDVFIANLRGNEGDFVLLKVTQVAWDESNAQQSFIAVEVRKDYGN